MKVDDDFDEFDKVLNEIEDENNLDVNKNSDFNDILNKSLNKFKSNDEDGNNDIGNDFDHDNLEGSSRLSGCKNTSETKSKSTNANTGSVDDDDDDNINSLLEGMMSDLLSKEILFEPLKELNESYPKFLNENKPPKISDKDYDNYSNQYNYIKQIINLFETDKNDSKNVLDLMSKIQDCGSPPKEIIGDFDNDLNLLNDCNLQ